MHTLQAIGLAPSLSKTTMAQTIQELLTAHPAPRRFLAVDAYGSIFRAHFAFIQRPLTNRAGETTSAVFGFMREVLAAAKRINPTHIAVAFDPPGGSFRNERYPAYKAQRPPTPTEIIWGAGKIRELLAALGIRTIETPGFEADDLIAALAHRFASPECNLFMLTSDKDYQQLLTDNCFMLKPSRGDEPFKIVTAQDLCDQYGLSSPEQFIDMLALWGDTADNVPGVPRIGEKTAAGLIAKYGSIKYVYANVGGLPKGQRTNLLEHRDQVDLARELVTLRQDAPIPENLEDYTLSTPDPQALLKLIDELDFRSMGTELKECFLKDSSDKPLILKNSEHSAETVHPQEAPVRYERLDDTQYDYRPVVTQAEFQEMMAKLANAEYIGLDVETDGLDIIDSRLISIQFSPGPHAGYLLRYPFPNTNWETTLQQRLFDDPARKWVGHNLKFDLQMLANAGFTLCGSIYDTLLIHYLLAPGEDHTLDSVAQKYLHYTPLSFKDTGVRIVDKQALWDDVSDQTLLRYAVEDADVSLRLLKALWPPLQKAALDKLYVQIEAPLVPILARMERNGIRVNNAVIHALASTISERAQQLADKIIAYAPALDLNPDSPKQIGEFLFDHLQIAEKPKKTARTKQYNTSETELQKYVQVHPAVQDILDYREVRKLQNTYVEVLPTLVHPKTGCIHARFNQMVTQTGRLSSSNPNLQNIPLHRPEGKLIREAFVSRFENGLILSADYSQVELRILAHYCQDDHLLEAFRQDRDVHAWTAARLFDVSISEVTPTMRDRAKTVNFSVIYGVSGFGLSQRMGMSVPEANRFIEGYFEAFPGVRTYLEQTKAYAHQHGYVQTLFGRRRALPELQDTRANIRSGAERMAINTPIQGTAADIMKIAMIRVDELLRQANLDACMVLQVHDELVIDTPPQELPTVAQLVQEGMSGAAALDVPLKVDVEVGTSWGNLQAYTPQA